VYVGEPKERINQSVESSNSEQKTRVWRGGLECTWSSVLLRVLSSSGPSVRDLFLPSLLHSIILYPSPATYSSLFLSLRL
jgi:hypothetical protein